MITLVVLGVAFILAVAIVVGIVDAAQASSWRQVAAERRAQWEARLPEFHGVDTSGVDTQDSAFDD